MKIFRAVFDHFRILFLLSVAFMGLMPYGSFDPSTMDFYVCIGAAVFTYGLTLLMLYKFQKDYRKNENTSLSRNLRIVVSIGFMSVLFMVFMPYGTFDPTKPGFYTCVAVALFIEFSIRALLNRFQTPPPTA